MSSVFPLKKGQLGFKSFTARGQGRVVTYVDGLLVTVTETWTFNGHVDDLAFTTFLDPQDAPHFYASERFFFGIVSRGVDMVHAGESFIHSPDFDAVVEVERPRKVTAARHFVLAAEPDASLIAFIEEMSDDVHYAVPSKLVVQANGEEN